MPQKVREIGKRGVEEAFVKRAQSKAVGFFAPKFWTPAQKGAPDRVVFKGIDDAVMLHKIFYGGSYETIEMYVRNVIIASAIEFVELKAPGKKPTPHQERYHDKLRKLGFKVRVIDSKEEAKRYDGS